MIWWSRWRMDRDGWRFDNLMSTVNHEHRQPRAPSTTSTVNHEHCINHEHREQRQPWAPSTMSTFNHEHVYGMMRIDISDKFRGFPPDATTCLSLLLNGPTTSTLSSTQSLCLKYGCTCGQCVDGFMSQRMKLALLFQAEVTYDILDLEISGGPSWCEFHEDIINHVTPAI